MSDPSPSTGEGPIILKVGFEFDDSLGEVLTQAKDLFSRRIKEHADLSLKDVTVAAEELIGVTGKIEHVAKIIFSVSEAVEQMKRVTKDITIIEKTLKYTEEVAAATKTITEAPLQAFTGVPSPTDYSGLVGATRFASKGTGVGEKSFMERLRSKVKGALGIEEVVKESIKKKEEKEITPETPQGVPLTQTEELKRSIAKKKRQQKKAAKSPVTLEGLTAEARIEFRRIQETIASQKIQELFVKEITHGWAARRGGSEVGEYTPVYEEMGVSGEWEPARFSGQAALATGATNVKKFLKERILSGLQLSPSAFAKLTPEEKETYTEARNEINDQILTSGGTFSAILGGANRETGDVGINVIAETDATPDNIDNLSRLSGAIETIVNASRKDCRDIYPDFIREIVINAAKKQEDDEKAWAQNAKIARQRASDIPRELITATGTIIQRTSDDDTEPTGDPSVNLMRPAISRKDFYFGKGLRTEMESIIASKIKHLRTDPSGISEGLHEMGIQTPEGFASLVDQVMAVLFEEIERDPYTGSPEKAKLGSVYGRSLRAAGTSGERRFMEDAGSETYERQQLREKQAWKILSGGPGVVNQALEKDPSLIDTFRGLFKSLATTPHLLSHGLVSRLKGGEPTDLQQRIGVGDEHVRRTATRLEDMSDSDLKTVLGEVLGEYFSEIETKIENVFDGFIRRIVEQLPAGSDIDDVVGAIRRAR